jgi:hypothetical protein
MENDYEQMRLKCDPNNVVSNRKSLWGKELQSKNLGVHNLGCGGYRGKDKIWAKEDAEMEAKGIANPWHRIADPQARRVIRSKYHYDPISKQLTMGEKVKRFEEILAAEEKFSASQTSSSQGSMTIGSRWDTALNRVVNVMKGREKTKPPTLAGRVLGEGLSVKWSDKYGRQQKGKKALSEAEARELHELRERVAQIPEIVDKCVADKVDTLFTEKMTAMMPRLFQAFRSWDAAGRVGLHPIPSIIGSNSSTAAPNVLVTPAANTAVVPHVADTAAPVANTVAQGLNASGGTRQ